MCVFSEGDDVNAVFHAFEFLNKEDSDEDEDDEVEEEEGEEGWLASSSVGVLRCALHAHRITFSYRVFFFLQGKLSFELEGAEEDDKDTESVLDEFQEGAMETESAEDRHRQEFSQQVKLYAQNKPRKPKKNIERELGK